MKTNILNTIMLSITVFLATSCYEDKGNYSYGEIPEVTAENLPENLSVVQKTENIVIDPVIKSSIDGLITEDNPNYEFGCKLYLVSGSFSNGSRFVDIDTLKTKKVDYIADFDANTYIAWYTVKDKRSGVTTNFQIPIKITSSTYEGWMVLCNVGTGNNVRLDMVSVLGADRKEAIHDILGDKAPALTNANQLIFDAWPKYGHGDYIKMCTQDGSYSLNQTTLKTEEVDNLKNSFILDLGTDKVVALGTLYLAANLVVTAEGNAYYQNNGRSNSAFELPINTFTVDGNPEFKVAPFIGTPQERPLSYYSRAALFYDIDNKRFVGWRQALASGATCFELEDPSDKLFSFTTGKDIIDMESTKFDDGTVYSILKDASNNRYLYGINVSGGSFSQTYYQQITAPGFNNATQFAFHSQYPYMFYNDDNKVYSYQLMSNKSAQPLTLDGEEITMLKFNLFQTVSNQLSDQSDAFLEQQYYLIVGSYKKNSTDDNGGILRFYKFDQSSGTLTKVMEYSGFGKIKDVTYRERCE